MGISKTSRRREFKTYRVRGHLRHANGLPAPQTKVAAFDKDLQSEQLLGEVMTDDRGTYIIEYSRDLLLGPVRGSANLVVRAYDIDDSLIGESSVQYGVRGEVTIDLTVVRDQTRLRKMFLWLISRLRGV